MTVSRTPTTTHSNHVKPLWKEIDSIVHNPNIYAKIVQLSTSRSTIRLSIILFHLSDTIYNYTLSNCSTKIDTDTHVIQLCVKHNLVSTCHSNQRPNIDERFRYNTNTTVVDQIVNKHPKKGSPVLTSMSDQFQSYCWWKGK